MKLKEENLMEESEKKEVEKPKKRITGIDNRISDTIDMVEGAHRGEDVIAIEQCKIVDHVKTIPTGIYKLDGSMGGGVPISCISLFWGSKGSAKTTTCMRVIGNANKMCARCYERLEKCTCGKGGPTRFVTAYFATEPIFFTEWSKKMGVDENYLLVVSPKTAEECLEVMVNVVKSGNVDLILLDSIAALIPEAEEESEMIQMQQGAQARVLGKFLRKVQSAIIESNKKLDRAPTFLFVNQVRQKIGMFVQGDVAPGGLAMGFATSLEVKFHAKSKAEVEKDDVLGDKPVAIEINFNVDKRRYGAPKSEGSYKLVLRDHQGKFPGEIADEKSMRIDAIKLGLIKKESGTYKFGDIDLGRNYEDIDEYLLKNKEFTNTLRDLVVETMVLLYK